MKVNIILLLIIIKKLLRKSIRVVRIITFVRIIRFKDESSPVELIRNLAIINNHDGGMKTIIADINEFIFRTRLKDVIVTRGSDILYA